MIDKIMAWLRKYAYPIQLTLLGVMVASAFLLYAAAQQNQSFIPFLIGVFVVSNLIILFTK